MSKDVKIRVAGKGGELPNKSSLEGAKLAVIKPKMEPIKLPKPPKGKKPKRIIF